MPTVKKTPASPQAKATPPKAGQEIPPRAQAGAGAKKTEGAPKPNSKEAKTPKK